MNLIKVISRWILLILIIIGLGSVYYFDLYKYLSFSTLQLHHQLMQEWTHQHYLIAVLSFIFIYVISVALSLPGAVYITIAGGFLFGPIATLYVIFSATLGATLLFVAVSTALGEWLASKASRWVSKMEKGFQENAFSYLLVLRLIPLFPFWAINIAAAVLRVRLKTFVIATFIGIIPGSFVYVMVGNGLHTLLARNQTPDLNIIFTPPILLPLLCLAILALLPVIYKWRKGIPNGKSKS